ncbi:MAG: GAF domain-containing SpoIIE family protein phosphatase [bacterium]
MPEKDSADPKSQSSPIPTQEGFDGLKIRYLELTALFEINKILNSSLELRTILDNVLLTPMGRLMISKGMVLLNDKNSILSVKNIKGVSTDLLNRQFSLEDYPQSSLLSRDLQDRQEPFFEEFRKQGMEILVPMIADDNYLGMVIYGEKFDRQSFTQDEIDFLESLANLAAIAVDKAVLFEDVREANRKLDKKIQELNTMFEISRELNSTLEESKVAQILSFAIMGEMLINKCIILVERDGRINLVVAKGVQDAIKELDYSLCKPALLGMFAAGQNHVKLGDLEPDPDHEEPCKILREGGIEYMIPMLSKDRVRGLIGIGNKINGQEVSTDELEFLETLGNETMISIENAQLVEEMLEKQRMEDELMIARDMQKQLLPQTLPDIPGIEIVGRNVSSREVGGDYYDCIKLSDHLYGLAIADVSGKSMPAALLMANIQASLRTLVLDYHETVETVSHINSIIYQNTTLDKFITFFYCILDTDKRSIIYTNAGHNPPYLLHADGSIETLEEGGLILGMMPDVPYQSATRELAPGDVLFMFTDGITEAMNDKDEEYGEERLEPLLKNMVQNPLTEIMDGVESSIMDFVGDMPQTDDMTMLAMKILH